MSNFRAFDKVITPAQGEIFVDPQPIPTYSGYFKDYGNEGSLEFTSGYTLRSITPELVEVDLIDPHGHDIIKSWIERGDYFVKFDKGNHQVSSGTVNGIELYFPVDNQPRFSFHIDDTQLLTDTNISGAVFHDAVRDEGLLMFDFPQHNMIFAGKTMKESPYNQYYTRPTGERIQGMIVSSEDGVAMLGYIPQRALNEMFYDATELENLNATYSNDSGNWLLAGTSTGTGVATVLTDERLNLESFPKGIYMVIWRTRQTSGTGRAYNWNKSNAATINLIQFTDTSYVYKYLTLNITEDLAGKLVQIIMRADSGVNITDYLVIVPMSNGHDFPLDLIRQSTTKRTNIKVLE